MGIFHRFIDDSGVRLVGFEAGGEGVASGRARRALRGRHPRRAARRVHLRPAGRRRPDRRVALASRPASTTPASARSTRTCSSSGRAEYRPITDERGDGGVLAALPHRGHHPRHRVARTPSPARWRSASELGRDAVLLVNLSGRGDKDVHTAAEWFGLHRRRGRRSEDAARQGRWGCSRERPRHHRGVPRRGPGRPRRLPPRRLPRRRGLDRGDDAWSRPASTSSRSACPTATRSWTARSSSAPPRAPGRRHPRRRRLHGLPRAVADTGAPALVMTYWNPVLRYGVDASPRDLAASGGGRPHHPRPHPRRGGRLDRRLRRLRARPGLPRRAQLDPGAPRQRDVRQPRVRLRRLAHGRHRHPGDASAPPPRRWSPAPARSPTSRYASGSGSPTATRPPRSAEYADGVIVGSALVRHARRRRHSRGGHRPSPGPRRRPAPPGSAAAAKGWRPPDAHRSAPRVPQPHDRGLEPRAAARPRLRHVHPRRDRRRDLDDPEAARRPAAGSRVRSSTSRPGPCRSASSAAGSTTSSPRRRPTSARAANPWNAFKVWEGGLGIWGAIALGALGAYIGCRRQGVRFLDFVDAAAPGILVAQAMGRFGN